MQSRCLKSAILTSVDSSLNSYKKMFKMCSFVADFPIKGQSERMLSANAILTYWKVSFTTIEREGIIFETMSAAFTNLINFESLEIAAVLTSLSVSERKLM